MISKTAEQIWGTALSMLSPGCLIDKFLDWVDELRCTMVPARVDRSAGNETPTDAQLDPLSA
jgi:hypothetical protein